MAKPIDHVRAKITRAKQNIQDFEIAAKAFSDTNPYEVRFKEDAEAGKRIYYMHRVDDAPLEIAAIAANVLQDLRSSLDNIAFQLERSACGGTKPKHRVYFPITSAASEYPALRARNIRAVAQSVIDAIDATEPYQGGNGHALWQLNDLNRTDKHEILVAAGPTLSGVDISGLMREDFRRRGLDDMAAAVPALFIKPLDPLFGLKVGDVLLTEPLRAAPIIIRPVDALIIPPHAVKRDRKFRFDIAFHKPGVIQGEPAIKTMQDMANLVSDIIEALGRFLP